MKAANERLPDETVFVEGSTYPRHKLKARIIKQKMIPYICADCGMKPFWNGKELVLQLEHKNGISNDNRLVNLAFLCPNCHSQTHSYAGRNSAGMRTALPTDYRKNKLAADKLKLEKALDGFQCSGWGWKTRLADKLNISPQKIEKFIKRVDPALYEQIDGCKL